MKQEYYGLRLSRCGAHPGTVTQQGNLSGLSTVRLCGSVSCRITSICTINGGGLQCCPEKNSTLTCNESSPREEILIKKRTICHYLLGHAGALHCRAIFRPDNFADSVGDARRDFVDAGVARERRQAVHEL